MRIRSSYRESTQPLIRLCQSTYVRNSRFPISRKFNIRSAYSYEWVILHKKCTRKLKNTVGLHAARYRKFSFLFKLVEIRIRCRKRVILGQRSRCHSFSTLIFLYITIHACQISRENENVYSLESIRFFPHTRTPQSTMTTSVNVVYMYAYLITSQPIRPK